MPEVGSWRRRYLYWLPAAVVAGGIFALSSFRLSEPFEDSFFARHDKLTHAAIYACLAWWVVWGWEGGKIGIPSYFRLVATVFVTAAYGVTDEIHQAFVPGRWSSFEDWLADVAGALAGVALFLLYRSFRAGLLRPLRETGGAGDAS